MSPKTVTLDIERTPGRFRVERGDFTIEGFFWDLSQYKFLLHRRLNLEEVVEWPRTICLAWRWLGQRKVQFAAEWEDGGHEAMVRKAWEVYHEADIVVGHNLKNFDTKHLMTSFRDLGLTPPAPHKTVDTLTAARRVFGDESMKLAALTQRLGIDTKTDAYEIGTAMAAVNGDRKAQRRLAAYNKGDIIATEALYLRLLPWIQNHPHVGLFGLDDDDCCGNCGSRNLERRGYAVTTLGKYARFQCRDCGRWGRGKKNVARVDVRPA